MSLVDRWRSLWDDIRLSPAQLPTMLTMPQDHVAWPDEEGLEPFRPDQHYFQVRVNELYLPFSREWITTYDPMVLVVAEFIYDKTEQAVPFVVGPALLEARGQEAPAGMVYSDTRVAGIHPYRGGRLVLSVVLSQVVRDHYAKKLLEIVESAASVLDFATALTTYVKVGDVVLDGVQALFGDKDGSRPLAGHRVEIDPDAGDEMSPRYFVLIDAPEEEVKAQQLWISQRRLLAGDNMETAKPYRGASYVLYSLVQSRTRQDHRTLPFYPLFERVKEAANSHVDADWTRAKADMASLWQTLILSPDLTEPQAEELRREYRAKLEQWITEAREQATEMSTLGAVDQEVGETERALREAADILNF